jgi:iron-sulfur cluster repair protein YtfE (RIC family)
LKQLDEFTFFKQQFGKLHASCKDFLMDVVEKLPAIRKDFLNRMLTTEKVANEPRNIFKIKRG